MGVSYPLVMMQAHCNGPSVVDLIHSGSVVIAA